MNQSTKIIIGAAAVVIVGGGIYAATTGQKNPMQKHTKVQSSVLY